MDNETSHNPVGGDGDRHSYIPGYKRPLIAWVAQLGAVVVGVILVILVAQTVYGQDTTHEQLANRIAILEEQAQFQTCVLGIPPARTNAATIAECQTASLPG